MCKTLIYKELPPPISQYSDSVKEGITARHNSPADASILSRVGRVVFLYASLLYVFNLL